MSGRLPSSDREHERRGESHDAAQEPLTAGVAMALLLVLLAGAAFVLTDQTALGILLAGLSWVPFGLCCVQAIKDRGGRNGRSSNLASVAPADAEGRCAAVPARVSRTTDDAVGREASVRQTPVVQRPMVAGVVGAGTQARTERSTRSATSRSSLMIHVVRRRGRDEVLWESLFHFVPPGASRDSAGCSPPG